MIMEQLLSIIKNFKNNKILVVGDLMLDEYILGEINRISPEAPIPILDVIGSKTFERMPGGAANTAYNVKSLGGNVMLVGVIGPDEKGKVLKEILEKRGVDTLGLIVDPQRKTTLKTRVCAGTNKHQIVRIDIEDRHFIDSTTEDALFSIIQSKIKGVNAIIISDYVKGVITPTLSQKIIKLAKENNILSLVDPAGGSSVGDNYFKYKNCNIIKPNKKELARALNIAFETLDNRGKFLEAGKMLLSHVMCDHMVVTLGSEGMTLFEKGGNSANYPALNEKAIDVSGAGDTAIGTMALALASGADLKQAVVLAGCACGIGVGKVGTAVVSPQELEDFLKNNLKHAED